jgi:uncharacterized protein YfiM (DUF2279 family)
MKPSWFDFLPLGLAISLLLMAVLLVPTAVNASQDKWLAPDKAQHLAAGYFIGGGSTLMFESPTWGFGMGCLAGALKEYSDSRDRANHTVSAKDFLVTCGGSWLGSKSGTYILERTNDRYKISVNIPLN